MELLILILGTLGLIAAFAFVIRKKLSKKSPELAAPASPDALPSPTSATGKTPTQTAATNRWWSALGKTREGFLSRLRGTDLSSLKETLEEACLTADLGVQNTQEALGGLDSSTLGALPEQQRLDSAKQGMAETLLSWLPAEASNSKNWPVRHNPDEPTVIWFVGVNGTGKTTSIAKFASELKARGHTLLLAAGDTFRAAAGEQLEIWAKRLDVPCVRGPEGADPSSVLFDAVKSGVAKKVDFVLCDSAGRLHNQNQLMEALAKNRRVLDKALPGAPHETLLVLDANTGQNMLSQAEHFQKAIGLTGLFLTKLDGTAKGGAVVAVARKTGLPLRRLGLGEQVEDLVAFQPKPFVEALLGL